MGRIEKAATWLDHGKTVFDILVSLGVGKGIGVLLHTFTQIPAQWITPIWLCVSAGLLLFLMRYVHARQQAAQSLGQQAVVASTPQPLATVTQFYNRLDPRYAAEVEASVRQTVAQIPPADKDTYYARALTVAFVYFQFEIIWSSIYGSQIKALEGLNNMQLKREGILPFYADAAKASPSAFANYSFDEWLGWMHTQTLIRYDGDLVGITIKGKDFLKFLIDDSKPVGLKSL